jgi:hypothetical protein
MAASFYSVHSSFSKTLEYIIVYLKYIASDIKYFQQERLPVGESKKPGLECKRPPQMSRPFLCKLIYMYKRVTYCQKASLNRKLFLSPTPFVPSNYLYRGRTIKAFC